MILLECLEYPPCAPHLHHVPFICSNFQIIESKHQQSDEEQSYQFITQSTPFLENCGQGARHPRSKPPNLNAKRTSCSLSLQDGGWFPPLEEPGLQQRCLVIREIHGRLMNPVGSTTERAREWRRELWAPKSASRSQTLHAKNHRDLEERQAHCRPHQSVRRPWGREGRQRLLPSHSKTKVT